MNHLTSTLLRMIYGNWQTCVVGAFAELGIADLLQRTPMTTEALAVETSTDVAALRRFLRCAAAMGLVGDGGAVPHTLGSLGELLRSDHPHSLRATARLNFVGYRYQPWGHLVEILRTGSGRGFSPTHEHGTLDYLAARHELREVFHTAMYELSTSEDESIAASYDFSPFHRVIDLGGGRGSFLEAVVRRNPHLTGVVFDRDDPAADTHTSGEDWSRRLERRTGDFFAGVPPDGDLYVMKNVIHNWLEHDAVQLLRGVRAAWEETRLPVLWADRRLLIIEHRLDDPAEGGRAAWLDLNFLILIGGGERDLDGYRSLASQTGFTLARVLPTPVGRSILELVAGDSAEPPC
jgi:O-methyltransferase domain